MHCLIINRNYPPQQGITGHSAHELVKYLTSKNIKVSIIHVEEDYFGGPKTNLKYYGKTYKIKTFYSGKKKLIRFLSSVFEGRNLVKKAISINPDIIIAMTDPPLLNFWMSYYSNKMNFSWIYWAMDIYPNAFVSAGLLNKNNLIYKLINKTLIKGYPDLIIALGKKQSEYLNKIYNKKIKSIILPCGITNQNQNTVKFNFDTKNKIIFGYVGNIGEAHNENFIKSVIHNIHKEKHILILSIYGSKSKEILKLAKDKKNIKIINHIKKEQLSLIDIHLVSLKEKWDHICVPSKSITAVSNGSTILFNCSSKNDNWILLEKAGWRINPGKEENDEIKKFLKKVSFKDVYVKRKYAEIIGEEMRELKKISFSRIYDYLKIK